ncbi:MAG: type VI secretion system contractile sheath large subunit [Candidatus Eisenbacteria bacterium]
MQPAPWNMIVLTDLGADHDGRIAVDPGAPGDWLGRLDARVAVKPRAASHAAAAWELRLSGREAFEARAIVERLPHADATTGAPAELLDAVLQNGDFRRIESAYRGISLIGEHGADALAVEVISVARRALSERFRDRVYQPALDGEIASPTAVLLDFDFSHQATDLALLQELAAMAAEIPCPIVAAASPALFGMRYWAHVAGIAELASPWMDAGHALWREFQASESARWVALTMNRYLQRAPVEVEGLGYREPVDEARPETFLWGRGIWLVGAALARSIRAHGHALDLAGRGGMFTGLPSRSYPHMGEPVALAAETPLPEMKASEVAWAGLTPVVGVLRQDAVVLPMVVTLFRLKPGRLTIEGTLAYQITAARIAQSLNEILGQMPRERNDAPGFLQAQLTEALGVLLEGDPSETLQIGWSKGEASTTEEAATGMTGSARDAGTPSAVSSPELLEIRVRPARPLEGKQAEFVYRLPWRGAPEA